MAIDIPSYILGKEKGGSIPSDMHQIKTFTNTIKVPANSEKFPQVVIGTPVSLLEAIYEGRGYGVFKFLVDGETRSIPVQVTKKILSSGAVFYEGYLTFVVKSDGVIRGALGKSSCIMHFAYDGKEGNTINGTSAAIRLVKKEYDNKTNTGSWGEYAGYNRNQLGLGDEVTYSVVYWD